jgi:quinoprotein glucose dehydrogenase
MMARPPATSLVLMLSVLITCSPPPSRSDEPGPGWPVVAGSQGGGHFTPLTQITAENVSQLHEAWVYHTGDYSPGAPGHRATTFEATPILANAMLYFCTPYNRVIALQAATGKLIWSHEPEPQLDRAYSKQHSLICRGVSYWQEPTPDANRACQTRIFQGVLDGRLEALDAHTGALCADFAGGGVIDLNKMDNGSVDVSEVNVTSAPVIFEDLVIVGSAISDNHAINMPSGFVRAFDARTGQERWHWSPIPEALRNRTGAGNVWAPMAIDTARGVLYAPTSSPSPDFWGGLRTDPLPHVDAVVALNARTGALIWQFQTVHHNLFDYDLPAQPTLIDVQHNERVIAAVAQPTKTGFLWVLNRETGESLFPVVERAAPQSDVPGEHTALTQPEPLLPPPFTLQRVTDADVWGLTPLDREACLHRIHALRNDGLFTPPSLRGSLVVPYFGGGSNWGGMAFDPRSHLAILNVMNIPGYVRLFPADNYAALKQAGGDEVGPMIGAPYGMQRGLLLSPIGIPCTRPPWGTISAVDLDTGEIRWQHPLGTQPIGVLGLNAPSKWGAANLGGPLVTGSGLVFIGATPDGMFRALNLQTGDVVWQHHLPYPGVATPMSFQAADGRQFVVIAAGGSILLNSPIGDALVAFALAPE